MFWLQTRERSVFGGPSVTRIMPYPLRYCRPSDRVLRPPDCPRATPRNCRIQPILAISSAVVCRPRSPLPLGALTMRTALLFIALLVAGCHTQWTEPELASSADVPPWLEMASSSKSFGKGDPER